MTELEAAIGARLESWSAERVAERLWAKDGSLWATSGKPPADVAAWLGWLDLPETMSARVAELEHLARDVRADGYRRAAVLGMGGSSLAPELFSRVFAATSGGAGGPAGNGAASADGLQLRILDSTHPDVVRGFRSWAAEQRTLFCVSSKSGSTTEPNAFQAAMGDVAPALDFLAITDPGSSLGELARAQEFRGIVEAPPDVGGRYSALTVFGLVPAALAGVDLGALLGRARSMANACRSPNAADNPGLALGAAIGEAALAGRDKLTILTSARLAAFGDWAEQLVAESTGKAGMGIVPVVDEPLGDPAGYGDDRFFVAITLAGDEPGELGALMELGHPGRHIELADPFDIGAEFVRWEVATAAAGIVLGIDPFDQPNVQESKDATKSLLEAFRTRGALPQPMPIVSGDGLAVFADPATLGDAPVDVDGVVRRLLSQLSAGRDYFAILAYLPSDREVIERLQRVRASVRDALGVATTLGFGPRFLHSTGQLHKGGPDTGVFLQLTADPSKDLPIPGWDESFATLIAAQALGDLSSLQRRGRRALRLHMGDMNAGLARLEAMVADAIGLTSTRT